MNQQRDVEKSKPIAPSHGLRIRPDHRRSFRWNSSSSFFGSDDSTGLTRWTLNPAALDCTRSSSWPSCGRNQVGTMDARVLADMPSGLEPVHTRWADIQHDHLRRQADCTV